ncbi:Uncharacterised protein [Klebsiella pneumoniae]|nr:Uncharacterised protein [Klebsiella pneumoniae]
MQCEGDRNQTYGTALLAYQLLRQAVWDITQLLNGFLHLAARGFGYISRFVEYPGHGLIGDARMASNVF